MRRRAVAVVAVAARARRPQRPRPRALLPGRYSRVDPLRPVRTQRAQPAATQRATGTPSPAAVPARSSAFANAVISLVDSASTFTGRTESNCSPSKPNARHSRLSPQGDSRAIPSKRSDPPQASASAPQSVPRAIPSRELNPSHFQHLRRSLRLETARAAPRWRSIHAANRRSNCLGSFLAMLVKHHTLPTGHSVRERQRIGNASAPSRPVRH